jgi:hypothetical protein
MDWRRFSRLRTGQSYRMQGLIFFVSANYELLPEPLREAVRESCRAAAGRSGNEEALLEYVTRGRTKRQIMTRYFIASETTIDRMVRSYFVELETRLRAWRGRTQ